MRIGAFARLAAAVATAFVAPASMAYAPPELDADVPAVAVPAPETMRPTTGRKGGLPAHVAPTPDPLAPPSYGEPGDGDADDPAALETAPVDPAAAAAIWEGRAHVGDIRHGDDALPAPVKARRDRLIAAAKTGDIEALREVFADQPGQPIVAELDAPADPIDFLRRQSGDEDGREILAILIELLEAGYVEVNEGGVTTYVWPYFAEVPLPELDGAQYVEVYRVLTAVDVEDMLRDGHYGFFRVGISADGRLRYFTAGNVE
jgi:hypothetical protein